MAIEFPVNIYPNREIITPMTFGDIAYTSPETFTTDQISEIVVVNSPLNFSRYGALFGKPSDVSFQLRRDRVNGYETAGELVVKPNQDTTTSFTAPATTVLENNTSPNPFEMASYTFNDLQPKVLSSELLNEQSSLYFPQLDFYPRYNQWFSSTSWPRPFDTNIYPEFYEVLFIYSDRATKTIYHAEGRAFLNLITTEPLASTSLSGDSVEITAATAVDTFVSSFSGYNLNCTTTFTSPIGGVVFDLVWTYYLFNSTISSDTGSRTVSFRTQYAVASPGSSTLTNVVAGRGTVGLSGSIVGTPIHLTITPRQGGITKAERWFNIT